ncbi:MAG: site-specific integrase [Chloroflexota bacterium]|nr:site-specific integrase [Chloroflexota bacterium]
MISTGKRCRRYTTAAAGAAASWLTASSYRAPCLKLTIPPHSLRHTFATYKAERGVTAFQLQQWLGHRNVNTTQIYVHLGRQNARKVMEGTSL